MKPDQDKRMRSLIAEALDRSNPSSNARSLKPALSAGDLFLLSVPIPIAVSWCAVFQHSRDQSLWYIVPGDQFSLLGSADIAVPEYAESGPLNFRCSCGLWMHVEDIPLENRFGKIDEFHVESIRDQLAQIAENRLSPADELLDVDVDPDYEEWIAEVEEAVDALGNHLVAIQNEAPAIVYLASTATANWVAEVGVQLESLAADTNGVVANVVPGLRVKHDGTGELIALIDESGVVLRLFNSDQVPLVFAGESDSISVDWMTLPECFSTQLVKWQDDVVYFVIGTRKFVIQR